MKVEEKKPLPMRHTVSCKYCGRNCTSHESRHEEVCGVCSSLMKKGALGP